MYVCMVILTVVKNGKTMSSLKRAVWDVHSTVVVLDVFIFLTAPSKPLEAFIIIESLLIRGFANYFFSYRNCNSHGMYA